MGYQETIHDLKHKFPQEIINIKSNSQKRAYVDIEPESLIKIANYIFHEKGARFNIASGVDCRDHIEILYHFTLEDINLVISLRVKLNRENPHIESLTPSIEALNWIEREMSELLGIEFKNHPDMRRLLLPDEWPQDVYPLRNDYKEWDDKAIRDRGV